MIKRRGIDKTLLFTTLILCFIGLIMVLSSTIFIAKEKYDDNLFFFKKQLLWLVLGMVIFAVIVNYKRPFYKKNSFVYLALLGSILLLILVFFSGKVNDSYRWIRFQGFSLQPSEFAKIAVILYLALVFNREPREINDIKRLLISLFPVMVIGILLLMEPDLGNFFLIVTITGIFVYFAGVKIRYLALGILGITPLLAMIFVLNRDKLERILALVDPERYADTVTYQMLQSVYAIGSGGIFGLGAGNSTQKLSFLPYAYSDFIYSIIGEEFGFVGAVTVLLLFLVFWIKGLRIARFSDDRQTYLLLCGFTYMIFIQAIINISVSLGLLPTNGIPLPFISCGGSSLIASLIMAGIIINVSKHRKLVFKND